MLSKWQKFFLFYGWIILHCMYILHFLYSFICWWALGSKDAALNMGVQLSFWDTDFVSFRCMPRGGIGGSKGGSIFNFWGVSILFSIAVVQIYIPTNSAQSSLFTTSSSTLVIVFLIIAIPIGVRWWQYGFHFPIFNPWFEIFRMTYIDIGKII